MKIGFKTCCLVLIFSALTACGGSNNSNSNSASNLDESLRETILEASNGEGLTVFILPESDDFSSIPQDVSNPITAEKVALGQMLFHETALATEAVNDDRVDSWSCASCHHMAAGFKAGVPQGIGEGGDGFGLLGEGRVLAAGFSPASTDPTLVPDLQPVTSPSVLNTAYQEVMLWNGQFGNAVGGLVNNGIHPSILSTMGTPKAENARQLAGLETQAIAGTAVHRLKTDTDSVLQTNPDYIAMFDSAFPSSTDATEDAGKAIAAYERTILANRAPFQLWLRGEPNNMTNQEKRGGLLFFGAAGCVDCHRGPALSSEEGASEDEMFFAIGFADFDINDPRIHTEPDDATSRGRGGFTGNTEDDYKFKIPQLYNLVDANIFGHGASFNSVREVIEYKNQALSQSTDATSNLDARFVPLGLSGEQIDDLTAFIENALYDAELARYVPDSLPTGACMPNADANSLVDLGC